ncbi:MULTISPECIES: metal-dependent hydrolase [Clostridium]|uniref:Metal-dependent hydrolase n=1 Tax=Clostridium cibarium TaxID=2762247 RepID=A0ABR8PW31_9CLOT|nr:MULTISPECIES: metal-dependent hydrolase [Clostridium]MBD7912338.1 metal-dependent hydrolase [Clostridium cibarium]
MIKRTHLAIGLAATIPLIMKNPISVLGVLGAIAPDWDKYLRLKHRTITHSLVALGVSTVGLYHVNKSVALVWGICYASHLLADALTIKGVPFFYPYKKKYGLKLLKTGDVKEYVIQLLAIAILILRYIR